MSEADHCKTDILDAARRLGAKNRRRELSGRSLNTARVRIVVLRYNGRRAQRTLEVTWTLVRTGLGTHFLSFGSKHCETPSKTCKDGEMTITAWLVLCRRALVAD